VDPGRLGQEQAQRVDGHEELDDGGQGTSAIGGASGRMRGDAVELEGYRHRGKGMADRDGLVAGVEHQRRVHIVEDAGLQFDDLAAGALLAGCADDAQRAGRLGQRLHQGRGRADPPLRRR